MAATELLKPTEAAARLRVHPVTLWRWTKAGKLPVVALTDGTTRYRASDVEAFIVGAVRVEGEQRPKQKPRPITTAPSWLDPKAINPITNEPYRPGRAAR